MLEHKPEGEADKLQAPRPTGGPDRTLFISYRVEDTGPTASRLFEDLAEAYGQECVFLDHERLEGGARWPERLVAEAQRASVMLVLIGEGWLRAQDPKTFVRRLDREDDWVRKEIEAALGAGALVVPLLVEGAEPPGQQAFATVPSLAPLADRQVLRLRRRDWDSDLERLQELLDAHGFVRRPPSAMDASPGQLEALVRERTTPLQELAESQRKLIARLERELALNELQVRAALEATGEAKVPAEQIAAKLGEVAGRFKTLREQARPAAGDDPRAKELKEQASQAIEEGNLKRANKLIDSPDIFPNRAPEEQARVVHRVGPKKAGGRWWLGMTLAVGVTAAAGGYAYLGLRPTREEAATRKAAEQGDATAQNTFGVRYAKDEAEAARWFRKAADQGDATAQTNLGQMYEDGRGVPKDEAEAVRWFRRAAYQGDARAQESLGRMYENGLGGLGKNEAEAIRWYRKAADQGDARAQESLGRMYENGLGGLGKNEAEAIRWYRKAADQGDAWAQESLARLGQTN